MAIPTNRKERHLLQAYAQTILARTDFQCFVRKMKPSFYVSPFSSRVCAAIDEFLLAVENEERPVLVLLGPPQHGKSELVSRMLPAYALGKHPSYRIGGCSYAADLARDMNRDVQRIILSQEYAETFPGTRLNVRRTAKHGVNEAMNSERFELVNQDGGYVGVGVGGPLTGKSLHIGIIDDPIKNMEEALSTTIKERVWRWYKSTFLTRLSQRSGQIIMQTRWTTDDLAGRILETEPRAKLLSFEALTENEDGTLSALVPRMHSVESLLEKKAIMAPWEWSALYEQRPVPRSGGYFKYEWFEIVDTLPDDVIRVRGWDFAASEGDVPYTCGVKISYSPRTSLYYVEDSTRGRWTPGKVEKVLVLTTTMDGRNVAVSMPQDPGQAGKSQKYSFTKLLAGYPVTFSPESGSKEVRAMPFAAQCEIGNVKLLRGAWNKDYIDELCVFPKGPYKDQVDASSRAFSWLVTQGFRRNRATPVAPQSVALA